MSDSGTELGKATRVLTVRFEPERGRGYWDITATDAEFIRMGNVVAMALKVFGGKVVEVHPVEVVPGSQLPPFASERAEKRGLK